MLFLLKILNVKFERKFYSKILCIAAKDRSNLKKEPSVQANNNAVIKNIKEVPRPSVQPREVAAKPTIERDIKTAAQPNRVVPPRAENNLAKVYEYNQNLVKNAGGLKKEPSVNGIPNNAPVKDLAQKQVVPNSKANLLRVKESEKPQRLSTPQISSKGAAVEPQQKLVGRIKADAPVIQRVILKLFIDFSDLSPIAKIIRRKRKATSVCLS